MRSTASGAVNGVARVHAAVPGQRVRRLSRVLMRWLGLGLRLARVGSAVSSARLGLARVQPCGLVSDRLLRCVA